MSHALFWVFLLLIDIFGFVSCNKIEDLVEKKMRVVGVFLSLS